MKTRHSVLALVVLGAVVASLYWHRTELRLRYARASFPAGWAPKGGWPVNKGPGRVSGGVQVGTVALGDGSRVPYWFLSHHHTSDYGGTLFELRGGRTVFMEGFFCCGVDFPDGTALQDDASFLVAVKSLDGLAP